MAMEESIFPVGMRVLLIDNDITSLGDVENLLKQCQYHVTTTNRGREALRMLKEDKTSFDIVITDMEMPDLDGIKLLQIVGLEMDLPVIMLSAHSDYKNVRKGIENGACDFLIKPVRIQELRNIWQHVVRKNRTLMLPTSNLATHGGRTVPQPTVKAGNEKAMEDNTINENNEGDSDDDDDDYDDNEDRELEGNDHSNGEATTRRKKTRLFWSVELHQKFVDAVNQLGQDKAFPKKILDIMDVEGLTREKVASHLQKYRLYLKKVKTGSSQETSKLSGIGADSAQIRALGLGGGYGIYRTLAGSTTFPSVTPSFSNQLSGKLVTQLNTASGLSMSCLPSSNMLQRHQFPISNTSLTTPTPNLSMPANLNNSNYATASLFQGLPTTMGMLPHQNKNPWSFCNGNSTDIISDFGKQSSLSVGVGPSFEQPQDIGASTSQNPLQPFHHNIFPSIGNPHNTIAPARDDPVDVFCGISSLEGGANGNHQNQYLLTAINGLSDVSQPHQSWQNHRADDIFNACNMPGGSNSLMTLTPPANFDGNISQSSDNIAHSPLGEMNGISSLIMQQNQSPDDPELFRGSKQNTSEYLEDIVERFLKQGNADAETGEGDLARDYS